MQLPKPKAPFRLDVVLKQHNRHMPAPVTGTPRWLAQSAALAGLLAPSTTWANSGPATGALTVGSAAAIGAVALGAAAVVAAAWWARSRQNAESTDVVALPESPAASPAPLRGLPPCPSIEAPQAPDAIEVAALAETLLLELRGAGTTQSSVELGWMIATNVPAIVEVPVNGLRALLSGLLHAAAGRTARGAISIRVETSDTHALRFEVEDTCEQGSFEVPAEVIAMAEALGAELSCEFTPQVGVLVRVDVPATWASDAPTEVTEPEDTDGPTVRIQGLGPLTAATLESQLRRCGHAVQVLARSEVLPPAGEGSHTIRGQPSLSEPSDDHTIEVVGGVAYQGGRCIGTLPLSTGTWNRTLTTARSTAGAKILLVDDNESGVYVVSRILSRLGVDVVHAPNGQAALEHASTADFDLVLMDCEMPGWSGLRTTAEFRRMEHELGRPRTPIIAMTAHDRGQIWDRFAAAGADEMATVPLRNETVISVFEQWIPGFTVGQPVVRPGSSGVSVAPAPAAPIGNLDPELFDLAAIAQLRELGDEREFARLVQVWLYSVEHLRAEVGSGLSHRDGARVRTAAHTLKSSMGNLGLSSIRECFINVEKLATINALGAVEALLQDFAPQLESAIAQLTAEMNQANAAVTVPEEPSAPASAADIAKFVVVDDQDGFDVLVVDDDPYICEVVRAALEAAGCKVRCASSGEAALEASRIRPPEMVVLDVQMSGIDGFETCTRMRANPLTSDIPVLIMTGHDDVASVERAFSIGADDFISKPFNPQLLGHRARFLRRSHVNFKELLENRERINTLAYVDRVTGLPNRARMLERLEEVEQACVDGQSSGMAVIFVDLDRFKAVNDTMGHAAGDQLLRAVGRRLTRVLGQHSVRVASGQPHLLARFGGDEFVILFEGVATREDARRLTQPLVEAIARSFTLGDAEVKIGASAGIAVYPMDGRSVDALLTTADSAMYRVKSVGGNGIQTISHTLKAEVNNEAQLFVELRRALTRGELEVFFQPRVDSESGTVCNAEALVRWRHPTRGLLLPGEFIQFAEKSGLIIDLGLQVLDTSLESLRMWDDEGLSLPRVSVNIAPAQLQRPDFSQTVLSLLAKHDLEPSRLELEVTESVMIDNFTVAVSALSTLRSAGVTIAIDDFGTGHSSLHYLHRLPVDVLKIDRSFTELLSSETPMVRGDPSAILSMLLALGNALSLRVVAEGVETQEQLVRLCRMGCDELQGYLISRPVPAEQLREFISQRSRRLA